ncbi:class I SAM-dependent methyltransferase [Aestuariicella sp. G3-2]|uniref:class I SAM-dependent methyltransferase n=1 Tax=Pseudomaricurvus albidus TaxID=2842452 RepID=UPI001C0CEE7E|nr:class I SAM-dependent methyltransferase [Aestuariicella albida]
MSILKEKVQQALAAATEKQESGSSTGLDSQRLFHGRGCVYPGYEQVTVDLYAPVLWVTFFKPNEDVEFEEQVTAEVTALAQVYGLEAVLVQRRYLQDSPSECVWGVLPENICAQRGSARFTIQLGGRQNTGFFLDMEPGREWLEQRAAGKRVLNLFAYTCAFSVVAQQAGASMVVNVDMSRGALNQGRENHRLNNLPTDPIRFLQENILKSWGRIRRPGPYDIAIIDPPSFQRGSFVASQDYRKLVRRLPEFMARDGDVLLCLNAPELGEDFLRQLVMDECPDCEFVSRLTPSADFPDADPDQQLKLMHFRYCPPSADVE